MASLNNLPIVLRGGVFPANFKGTPEQFYQKMLELTTLASQTQYSLFTAGTIAPTSDTGPWLKDNVSWRVWDSGAGSYVPLVVEDQSLKYILQAAAPDQNVYNLWVTLDGEGKAQGVFKYSGGVWKDVYEDILALYLTTAAAATTYLTQANAATTYRTLTGSYSNTAIDAFFAGESGGKKQIDWSNVLNKPVNNDFRAQKQASVQTVTAGTGDNLVVLDVEVFDTNNVFATNRFTCPTGGGGLYFLTAAVEFLKASGTPTAVQSRMGIRLNGSTDIGQTLFQSTDTGLAHTMACNTLIRLSPTNYIELTVNFEATPGAATYDIGNTPNTVMSGHRISA